MAASYWDKFTRQRISRRRALQAAGATGAVAGAAWLVGCGSGDDKDGVQPTAQPTTTGPLFNETPASGAKRGGRHKDVVTANFDTFDPHLGVASSTAYHVRNYNLPLNRATTTDAFVFNDMAESLERIDDVTYNFKLRPGVKIGPNDLGVPERDMDWQDAVASYDRMNTEPRANNGAFVKQHLNTWTVSADGQTLTMTTKKPYAWFLNRIGIGVGSIAPRELIAQPGRMKDKSAGGGPFTLKRSTEGASATLDANPSYYRTGTPLIEGIDVSVIPDRTARRTAFTSRQIYVYGAENIDEANELVNDGYQLVRSPSFSFISLTMNAQEAPWTDERVRKAVGFSVNRKQLIQLIAKGEARPNGIVHWPLGAFAIAEDELESNFQRVDPDESKRLLKEAGVEEVEMIFPTLDPIPNYLPIILQQLEAGGFKIKQEPQDFTTWLDNYRTRKYKFSLSLNLPYEWAEIPLSFHHSLGPIGDGSYVAGLKDPDVDAAIDKANTTTEPEALRDNVRAAQELLYEKGPNFLPLYSGYNFTMYQPFVRDIPQGLAASGLLVNTWWLDL